MSTWSIFWLGEPRGSFWDSFTISTFWPEHSFMDKSYRVVWWWWWGGGPCDFSVSPWSKSFFFLFLGDFYLTWGPVGTGARTQTWTRAWQYGSRGYNIYFDLTICKRKLLPLSRRFSVSKSFPFQCSEKMSLSNLWANEGPQFSALVNPANYLEASKFLQKFRFLF